MLVALQCVVFTALGCQELNFHQLSVLFYVSVDLSLVMTLPFGRKGYEVVLEHPLCCSVVSYGTLIFC